jgi:hypothetical protein
MGQMLPMDSGSPFRPSQQAIRTSWTPRFFSSASQHPGLGALAAGADPHPQYVPLAVEVDPDGDVDRAVGNGAVADLHHDGVDHDDRVDAVQGAVAPGVQLLADLVCRTGDQVAGDVDVVDLRQVGLDLAGGQALGIQRQDRGVEALHPPRVLGHHGRGEGPGPVPGDVQLDRPDVGQHRLAGRSVAGVARSGTGRIALLVAEMLGHLGLQRAFQDQFDQPGQQPAFADQVHPLAAGPLDQLLGQIPVQLGRTRQLRPRPYDVRVLAGVLILDPHAWSFPAETTSHAIRVTPGHTQSLGQSPLWRRKADHPSLPIFTRAVPITCRVAE